MGTGRSGATTSAKVLALVLCGAFPLLVAAPAGAAAAGECRPGNGLVSGLIGGLCETINGVVGGVLGGSPVEITVDPAETLEEVTDRVLPKPAAPEPSAPETPADEPLPEGTLGERPGDGEAAEETQPVPEPDPAPASARPRETPREDLPGETARPQTPGHRRPAGRPSPDPEPGPSAGPARPAASPAPRRLDAEGPHLHLLWPGGQALPSPGRAAAAPGRGAPADDPLSTVLTACLLLSAILATRVISARRFRAAAAQSIPLEPAPGRRQRPCASS